MASVTNIFSYGKFINGELDDTFNQRLDWFIESDYYTSNIPLHFMFFNDATNIEVEDIKNNPRYIGFNVDRYKLGDKVVLFYANESVLNYPDDFGISQEIYKIQTIINYFNIPLSNIILLANVHQHNKTFTSIGLNLGLKLSQILLIDYYELQTYFFHKVLGSDHNKSYNPNAVKDIRYMFGKVSKPIRIITMYKLWQKGLLDNAVTGCLVDYNDIDDLAEQVSLEFNTLYKQHIEQQSIAEMLRKYYGSPDSVSHLYFKDSYGAVSNHCPSYPYNYKILFEDTKVSLIPETYVYNYNRPNFITEKTYKTIYNHHPFTILGTPGILKTLKSKGYKTFDGICNEIYDQCSNDRKRSDLVINSTLEILRSSKQEEIDLITKYNFAQLEKNSLETVKQLNTIILNNFS